MTSTLRLSISEYFWAGGSQFPPALAQAAGKELDSLKDQLGRYPGPRDVLEFARAQPKSALHQCFDWNRDTAAEAHWLSTAGAILRAIKVRIVVGSPEHERKKRQVVIETRAFHRVTPERAGLTDGKAYVSALETLPNFHYRTQLIEGALAELDRWTSKHEHLHELDVFFRKLGEANEEYGRPGAAASAGSAKRGVARRSKTG